MAKKIPFPLVIVEWKDHFSQDAWTEQRFLENAPEMCLSVGWLIDDKEDHIKVSSCISPLDPTGGVVGGTWFILKNCITDFKVIRKGKNVKK